MLMTATQPALNKFLWDEEARALLRSETRRLQFDFEKVSIALQSQYKISACQLTSSECRIAYAEEYFLQTQEDSSSDSPAIRIEDSMSFSNIMDVVEIRSKRSSQRKQKIFDRVLAALCPLSGELPLEESAEMEQLKSNMALAKSVEEFEVERKMKHAAEMEEVYWIENEREKLRQRYLPGSIDSEGIMPSTASFSTDINGIESQDITEGTTEQASVYDINGCGLFSDESLDFVLEQIEKDLDARACGREENLESPSELGQVLAFLEKEAAQRTVTLSALPLPFATPFVSSSSEASVVMPRNSGSASASAKSSSRGTETASIMSEKEGEEEEQDNSSRAHRGAPSPSLQVAPTTNTKVSQSHQREEFAVPSAAMTRPSEGARTGRVRDGGRGRGYTHRTSQDMGVIAEGRGSGGGRGSNCGGSEGGDEEDSHGEYKDSNRDEEDEEWISTRSSMKSKSMQYKPSHPSSSLSSSSSSSHPSSSSFSSFSHSSSSISSFSHSSSSSSVASSVTSALSSALCHHASKSLAAVHVDVDEIVSVPSSSTQPIVSSLHYEGVLSSIKVGVRVREGGFKMTTAVPASVLHCDNVATLESGINLLDLSSSQPSAILEALQVNTQNSKHSVTDINTHTVTATPITQPNNTSTDGQQETQHELSISQQDTQQQQQQQQLSGSLLSGRSESGTRKRIAPRVLGTKIPTQSQLQSQSHSSS